MFGEIPVGCAALQESRGSPESPLAVVKVRAAGDRAAAVVPSMQARAASLEQEVEPALGEFSENWQISRGRYGA